MRHQARFGMLITFVAILGVHAALAAPLPVGSIIGSKNAVLDGQRALPSSAVLSGDQLKVQDGLAMVMLQQGSRVVLGRQTEAGFLRDSDGVTVSLSRGHLSLYHPQTGKRMRLRLGDVTIVPSEGFRTLGEVAMLDDLIVVTAKEGRLQVENDGSTQEVDSGKTISIPIKSARTPLPNPSGNTHLNRNRTKILEWALVGAAVGATAIVLESRSSQEASPVAPGL